MLRIFVENKFMIEAIDWSLQDIYNIDTPNGSLVILYSGDFCQALFAVVDRGQKQIVEAC